MYKRNAGTSETERKEMLFSYCDLSLEPDVEEVY